jgi:uncharacterized membrane protein YczE
MSGMEGLGRVFNIIPLADTVGFSLSECSAVSLIFTASSTSTTSAAFSAAKTFAGSYDNFTTAAGFGQTTRWYQNTSKTGTATWTKQVASWSTATLTLGATSGYVSVVDVFGTQMADGYKYLKVTCTNATVIAVTHDLTVQRTPANLAILGA